MKCLAEFQTERQFELTWNAGTQWVIKSKLFAVIPKLERTTPNGSKGFKRGWFPESVYEQLLQ